MNFFLQIFFFFAFFYFSGCEDSVNKGRFVFSAPKRFLAGSDENVCISFREKRKGPVDLHVSILEEKKNDEIVSTFQQIAQDEDTKCFKISMPRTKVSKGRLRLTIHFKTEEDYEVNYIKQIHIQSNPDITFIQTDKPVYNGGQIVRFRIFTLLPDFKPSFEAIDQIHVENPNGIHIAQWLNVSATEGFIDKNFSLSNHPLPGTWRIKVKKREDDLETQTFSVEDYVLPRFSVILKAPESVEPPFNLNLTACAQYTFGKPVRGNVVFHISVKCPFTYYCRNRGYSMKKRFQLDVDGCVTHEIQLTNITSLAQKLIVNTTVEEDGTNAKISTSSDVEIKQFDKSVAQFSIFVRKRHLKPGLPLKGKILAKNLEPNSAIPMSLCLVIEEKRICEGLIIKNNETEFSLPPTSLQISESYVTSVELEYGNKTETVARLGLIPWYSPSKSYLQLENLSEGILKCGSLQNFKASYSMPSGSTPMKFQYMIKSLGDIISEGAFLVNSGNETNSKILKNHQNPYFRDGKKMIVNHFTFELEIDHKMSPISYLLLFHIRSDGEIVADTLPINVEKCLANKVDLIWRSKESKPGAKNAMKIQSLPNSVCALSVVDQSLKLISESANINEDAVFKAIEKFEIKPQFSEYCSDRYQIRNNDHKSDALEPLYDATTGISRFVDSLQAFDDFGVAVITDLTLETRPCIENEKVAGELINNLTSRHSVVKIDDENHLSGNYDWYEESLGNAPTLNAKYLTKQSAADNFRSFFPETWIWDIVRLNSSGEKEMEIYMPHTLTTWNADAICLSPNEGLGISKTSEARSFKPFFIDFILPKSVKRKEILHLQVSIFNYLDEALPIKISFVQSENFASKSEDTVRLCVEPKTKYVHILPLEAIKLGEADVKINGEVDFEPLKNCDNSFNKSLDSADPSEVNFRDTVLKKTTVVYEGFPVENVKSGFICGENDNFESSIAWNLKLPVDIVESSVSISALISGDILGPAFQNTNNLISLPTGCGEQNMILLVPNLLLLEYFLLTKYKDLNLIETALKNLDIGYQNQLKYKRQDGSYSAFGEKDEKGSIWLTAFVVRYFSQAQKFIHVDRNDLKSSVRWITKHQLENGCFPVIGKFYHQDIKKKILEEDSSKTLTAYILISLIECGLSPKTSTVVKNAIYCLKRTDDEPVGLYGDLMTTYALILAEEEREARGMMTDLLVEAKRSYRMLWWENEENTSVESSIEMTAYGILSLIKLGGSHFLAAASDAIRWITQYRNQNGGFVSTQDTIVALEAIAKFSKILPKMNEEDKLSISVRSTSVPHIFNISLENRMLQQNLGLESYATNVTFNAEGKGCALVQTIIRYNTRRGTHSEKFKVNLKIDPVSEIDVQTIKKVHVCVRYKGSKEKINMAVLEIFMVSGFYPDRSSLYDIPISHRGVRMWEEFENKVDFYFEDLRNKKVCLQFLVKQEICVENASPALIKLYDYYNTQYQSTIRYNLQSRCNQSQTWLDSSDEIKNEAKRELRLEDFTLRPERFKRTTEEVINGFQDIDFDLETPQGGNGIMPVFALPPPPGSKDQNCPLCLTTVPELFPKMYCSAQAAVKVFIRGKDIFDFRLDLTPRKNITSLRRTVSFTMKKDCECPVLNSVNSYALLLVTPPRTVSVNVLQEMHLDSLTQLYTLEKGDEFPKFVTDAIDYCKNWKFDE